MQAQEHSARKRKTFETSEEQEAQVQKVADERFEGRFSMAVRYLLDRGLEVID